MIDELILGGIISKIINDNVDVSRNTIRRVANNRNNKHKNLDSQIYNVIIETLNNITYNEYANNQEKIYEATEILLKSFTDSTKNMQEKIRLCLRALYLRDNDDKCLEFKSLLYEEIRKDKYEELYRGIILLNQEQESIKTSRIEQKIDKMNQKLEDNRRNENDDISIPNKGVKQKIKSRTKEYADKWNSNMFLNDFDKRDEKAGVNIKLGEVYLDEHLPHYIWGDNETPNTDLKEFLSEYINEKTKNKMLLMLGQPGIGKSTLITWIVANFVDKINDILVYRFTDLKDIDWYADDISNRIIQELGLSDNDLDEKVLIFDGFDEINVSGNREKILDLIYINLIYKKNIRNFSIIITCRENYVELLWSIQCEYITLQSWNEKQIKSFCKIFQEKTNINISKNTVENIITNKQILGIPLILYMVVALNISIEKEGSIVDVYDKIFSLEGGIYDRCIDNKSFASPHRIKEIKRQIHQISRDIAIWMFENNSEEASILQEDYQKICDIVMKDIEQKDEDIKQDFLIGNYFRNIKHCEEIETEKIYFIHRSIYEYFVVETIYEAIKQSMTKLSEESQEELAGNIAWYLKQGEISITIGEYLQHKILKLYNKLTIEKGERFYQWWENAVDKMMNYGMFYYTKKNIQNFSNIITKELQCFSNLLQLLRELLCVSQKQYILMDIDKTLLEKYIRHYLIEYRILKKTANKVKLSKINLSKVDLSNINLTGVCLAEINLQETDLQGAKLQEVNLYKTDLQKANLSGADLTETNLVKAKLQEAILYNTKLQRANLNKAYLQGADLRKANLTEANLSGVQLDKLILEGADIDLSVWEKYNLEKILQKLRKVKFKRIIIAGNNKREVLYKDKLFFDGGII